MRRGLADRELQGDVVPGIADGLRAVRVQEAIEASRVRFSRSPKGRPVRQIRAFGIAEAARKAMVAPDLEAFCSQQIVELARALRTGCIAR